MNNIVIYHKNCLDGTCAAWVASQYLDKDNTEYFPVSYNESVFTQMGKPIQDKENKTLYILDWCPDMSELDALCKLFKQVILIDHHESAIRKLLGHYTDSTPINLETFLAYRNEWSGAMGTAIWFGANIEANKEAGQRQYIDHWLVKAVDDRDRWQFKYPDTKAINEGLFHLGFNLAVWRNTDFGPHKEDILIHTGRILLEKKQQDCQAIIQSSAVLDDNKEKVIFCNCPYFLASEVGNILAKDYRLAVLWFMDKDGQISVSLRSNSATPDWINCSKIAMEFNGGGHANAAGFKVDSSFEEMVCALDDALIDTEQSIELY